MDQEYGLNAISWEDKGFEDRTVDRLMVAFTENLNIDDMLLCKCLSEQLISDDDVSRIGATLKAGRRCEAVRDLLLRIKRNPPNYLETFCGVLGYSKSNFFLESRVKEGTLNQRITCIIDKISISRLASVRRHCTYPRELISCYKSPGYEVANREIMREITI